MATALHKAITDAVASARYSERDILVSAVLEATTPLAADESLLYRSVYTIFRALPDRLVPGSVLNIATSDLPEGGGVELFWEARERLGPIEGARSLSRALAVGPHGDLVEIAFHALESFCNMRAGHVEMTRERVAQSSSLPLPDYVIRRVIAVIPAQPARASQGQAQADVVDVPDRAPERARTRSGSRGRGRATRRRPALAVSR